MAELFKFRKASSTVPDLSGIRGFGGKKAWNEGERLDSQHPATEEYERAIEEKPEEVKPSYFAPQASIIRLGVDVAVKVVVQTLIRDEKALEELREKVQSAAYQIERHIQERLDGGNSVKENAETVE